MTKGRVKLEADFLSAQAINQLRGIVTQGRHDGQPKPLQDNAVQRVQLCCSESQHVTCPAQLVRDAQVRIR
jgi:hypothetical protein